MRIQARTSDCSQCSKLGAGFSFLGASHVTRRFENVSLFDDTPPMSGPVVAEPADRDLVRTAQKLPRNIYLGTSSWNFPGWRGIVWSHASGLSQLSQQGLPAYSKYPIFRTVGIDRAFYRPLQKSVYAGFADQVPDDFRFLVKAPQIVCDSVLRDHTGRPMHANPDYLNAVRALEEFVLPAVEGLGNKAGVLVFEMPNIPRHALIERPAQYAAIATMADFFSQIKSRMPTQSVTLAVEMRTRVLLTPRWVKEMASTGVRPVLSLHPSMPSIMRQTDMLRLFDAPGVEVGPWQAAGDIVIRWSLAAGGTYSGLKRDWAPFNRIQQEDIVAREGIVWLLELAKASGVRAFVVANNKAEGCAPLTMRAIAESLTGTWQKAKPE